MLVFVSRLDRMGVRGVWLQRWKQQVDHLVKPLVNGRQFFLDPVYPDEYSPGDAEVRQKGDLPTGRLHWQLLVDAGDPVGLTIVA